MLGHSQPATTARYAHLADDPVRAASEAVGKYIASAMESTKGEVAVFAKSKRSTATLTALDSVPSRIATLSLCK